jgi:hypothetical protein
MLEFITVLAEKFDFDYDFDFSILVEKNPIKKTFTYLTKVLAVLLKSSETKRLIRYDELVENDLEFVEVKQTSRRVMGTRKNPFWINGNSKVQTYKDNEFIEYSFMNSSKKDLEFVAKIRAKYNIIEPHVYEGRKVALDDDLMNLD